MKFLVKVLSFLTLGMELLVTLVAVIGGIGGAITVIYIPLVILLAITGCGIISKRKLIRQIGNVALLIVTIIHGIMGYYDYIKWFSTKVGIAIFIYFIIINILAKILKIDRE